MKYSCKLRLSGKLQVSVARRRGGSDSLGCDAYNSGKGRRSGKRRAERKKKGKMNGRREEDVREGTGKRKGDNDNK